MELYKKIRESNNYEISDLGNFRNAKTGIIHKIQPPSWGKYLTVKFFVDGKRRSRSVHQLVATAHIPNPENKKCVNHKFGDKFDNRAISLEWSTYSENNQHAYDTGLKLYRPMHNKGKFGKDHNRSKTVYQYDLNKNFIASFGSISEAYRITKIHFCGISNCAIGKLKTSHGFIWSYNPMHFSMMDM